MAHLTLEQRYEIEALNKHGFSQSEIANHIGKNRSVICRELHRNSDQRNHVYKAVLADEKTRSRHKEKPKKIQFTEEVEETIVKLLKQDYSPEQIVGISKKEGLEYVSVERIYQFIWSDKKQRGELYLHLRSKGKKYSKRGSTNSSRGQIVNRVDIDQRPAIVEKKERIGDLEIDLVIGKNHKGALLTINDRASGVLKLAKVESKEASVIEKKAIELLQDWKPFIHTITSDNGKEFANHMNIANELSIDFYFAKPYHSWERGANENLNGLVRQYFPKKMSFDSITQDQINEVENKLNNRPRKRFGFKTPNEIFSSKLNNNQFVAFIN